MMEYAKEAYKTTGMSQNAYMETVTGFAAALTKSVEAAGGSIDEAVEYADTAMLDMADNANKMGSNLESIKTAYQGFAKQNYTMLDNLKLGYGGTKEEMERLIEDANKLREEQGLSADLTIESYADIITAIHEVQTEMGITGTTAKEASSTISGSVASMKSAWENLLVGLADDEQDFGLLLDNFVESVVTVGDNLIPRIETAVDGVGKLLLSFADTLLPMIVQVLVEHLPQIIETGIKLLSSLMVGFAKALPLLVQYMPEIIEAVVEAIIEAVPELKDAGVQLIKGLWEGIKSMGSWIKDKISGFMGGIVDNVKGVLGIHSPSKVFAQIGGFMAEGLGEGWDDEYSAIKRDIAGGLNFGTGSIGFESSGMSRMASAMAGGSTGDIVLNLTSAIDGAVLARNQYRYNAAEAARHGTNLVMA